MSDVEIGIGKSGRRAYSFDEVAIVPSRRTRDRDEVSISWDIDAYHFDLPMLAAPMDGVTSPATAIEVGRLGGLGVLDAEGLWTRYADPGSLLEEIAGLDDDAAVARLREAYAAPVQPDLIAARIGEIRAAGVTVAASLTPPRVTALHKHVLDAGVDMLVIHGTVVSAEHLSTRTEPLDLSRFIGDLDIPVVVGGCASFSTALHLARTGAAGIIVGVGPGQSSTTRGVLGVGVPMATAVADVAGARMRYLDESGGRYVHVIAGGGMWTSGDVAKAIACGADAVMLGAPLARAAEAPGGGFHWGRRAGHADLPQGTRVRTGTVGTLAEILVGPATVEDGTTNLFGGLRAALAVTGYANVKEFQKAEVMVAPGLLAEGKSLQRAQGVGLAR